MKKFILLVGISLLFIQHGFSQASIDEQIRITVNENELDNFTVIPGKKIVAYGTSKDKNNNCILLIKVYDKNLEEKQSKEFKVFNRKATTLIKLSKDSTELYFIATDNRQMQTIAYNFESDESEIHQTTLDKSAKSIVKHFTSATAGSKIFLLGTLKNAPCLLSVDMHHGTTSLIVPKGTSKKTQMKIISDDDAQDITLGFYTEKIQKATTYNILHITSQGEMETNVIRIPMQEEKTFLNGTFSYGKNNDYFVVGGYSKSVTAAQGIYLVHGNGEEILETKYYDFDEVKDFYSYLPQRRQERIEKKKKKNKFNTSAMVTVHGIETLGKNFVILGEVFFPTYRTETRTTYVNGRAQTTTTQVFDGYQYTHSVIFETDNEFNMVHNDVFLMSVGYKPYWPKQFVKIESGKKSLSFTYNSYDETNNYTYTTEELGENVSLQLPQREKYVNEKYQYVRTLTTSKWYGNYYISAHFETVKDKEAERGQRKQTYLVLTKIKF